ncbi:hypothetical protein H5410_042972 [Solanum commersonii]|uniref:Uncharacterized protein n=1 Tax=Solanum commersonii TaxID=4109 RepID=A0A9J5XXI8_SOLCO|nr:hypothetical protein H5410_042972 [Solanum commersonii]
MAESLLQILLENLTSFIQGEVGLILGFKDEFETLQRTFTTIQAVLEDAQEKQLKDKPIENWLQNLNVAAYEADDILDECKTEAARLKQTKYGSYQPKAIAFRYKIGKKMKNIMKKKNAIAADRIKFHLEIRPIQRQAARPQTGSVLTEKQVYGRGKELDEIVKILINNAQQLSVLPILEYIEGNSVSNMDLAPLQKKLQELLNGKRYLLVLDDVWNEIQQKWADLRAVLNVGASGASVLITTRLEKVGSIMGTLQPYELSYLSQEDCLSLIMQSAFGQQKEINPNLVAIGKEIVKKCGGVPLAAKTLGGLLRFKREEREWEHVRDSEIWNLPQDESSILSALRLSYHYLSLDLKQCFVYFAVLPKDTKMEKENLIFLWMAHGFL